MYAPTTPNHVEIAIRAGIGYLPTPLTREAAADYFDRRAAFCLTTAANVLVLADKVGDLGDMTAMAELVDEARDFMAEYRRINAMRTNPV